MQLLLSRKIFLTCWASISTLSTNTLTRELHSSRRVDSTTLLDPAAVRVASISIGVVSPSSRERRRTWARAIRQATTDYLQDHNTRNPAPDSPTTAAALIRLAFHDAVTGSPNGSIRYELDWSENRALSQPLSVVEQIYVAHSSLLSSALVGSLADALALVAVQAIEFTGGPHIAIRLGRPDQNQADAYYLETPLSHQTTKRSLVTKTMPDAGLDSDGLRLYFGRLGLTEAEFVALSGIHGLGQHVLLLGMDKDCLKHLT